MQRRNRLERIARSCGCMALLVGFGFVGGAVAAGANLVDDRVGSAAPSVIDSLLSGPILETQANVFTGSTQDRGALAALPGGGFVAVWDSRRQEHGSYAVVAQRFDAFGRPVGGETPVNAFMRSMQECAAVASSGENVWFVWQSHGQDGSGSGIVARRFSRDLADASPEIAVNETQAGQQMAPAIVDDGRGGAAIVWIDDSAGRGRVMLRLIGADGAPSSGELLLSEGHGGRDACATVIRQGEEFLVAWGRTDAQHNPNTLIARRVAADGSLVGDEMVLNEMDGRDHIEPSLAATADGGFMAAWHASADLGFDILVQRFDCEGKPAGEAVTAAAAANGWKSGAGIVRVRDNQFAVVYNSDGAGGDGHGAGVMVRFLDGDGQALGDAAVVNAHVEGAQSMTASTGAARLLVDDAGRLAVCWNGASREGDETSVNLTVRVPAGLDVAPTTWEGERLAYQPGPMDLETPIPPIWDPNHVALEPFDGPGGDGPDFGFEGVTSTGWTPPDPELAVGPDRIIAIVNGQIACFDKTGNNLFRDEIENSFGFWGELGANNFVFDPEALWDPHHQRFFAMACERSDNGRSMFLLAVSKTGSPNTRDDWWKYRLDVTSISDNDIDSPNMAVDDENVLLSADFFGPDKYLLYFITKASILNGGAPVTRHELITGAGQQSMGIPVMYDANAPGQYILQSTELTTNTTVIFHAVRDPFGTYSRTTYTLTVPTYTYPNQPPQRGSSSRPFLFEPRFWSCMQRNGSLWAVHHVNNQRARARWYEFDMRGWPESGNTPVIAQWGELDYGGTIHTFFPSIGVDEEGNAAITFARSSPDEYISMSRAVRRFSDPPNTFQPPEFVKESTAPHTSGRWGDYSATEEDPVSVGSLWGHHEYTLNGQWRTWIARYDIGAPPMTLVASPLFAGVRATLDVTGATPDQTVAFLYSIVGLGNTYIPQLDVTVGIASPVLAGVRTADANGAASLSKQVPGGTSGRRVWLQAAEYQRASNIVEAVIQ